MHSRPSGAGIRRISAQSKRPPAPIKRQKPATTAAKHLNSRQRKFADLVLSGIPAGRAYEQPDTRPRGIADSVAAEP